MSDKKKVIYVKDLVIKADNVTIEPPKRHHRPFDPFFGPVRGVEGEDDKGDRDFDEKEDKYDHDDAEGVEDESSDDDKRPFSWI